MPTVVRPSGLTISLPKGYSLATATRGRKTPLPRGPVRLPPGKSAPAVAGLLDALAAQEMTLADQVVLQPPPPGPQLGARKPAAATRTVDFELVVAAHEDAVLLLEQDGVLSWNFPSKAETQETERGPLRAAPIRTLRFRVEVGGKPRTTPADSRRSWLADLVWDDVIVHVYKFAARMVVGGAIQYLERNVRKGLVRITGTDPEQWRMADLPRLGAAVNNRPARILLFLHGTFSSTVGSFGGMCVTPWGKEWIETAKSNYDFLLGYDHPTLSEDPLLNASHLLDQLRQLCPAHPPAIDVVAFSRGGLVFRSLVEQLLPISAYQPKMRRAVFVACPNSGTELARPDNWHQLLDLYTNLVVAGCRAMTLFPQAAAASIVLKEAVQSVGAFVKCLATQSVSSQTAPGLAAMTPDGGFITALNQTQPNQPGPGATQYFAISAEFQPRIEEGLPGELPKKLLLALAGGVMDRVMGEPNDLVVSSSSVTAFDPGPASWMTDCYDFGKTPNVYHTVYFVRPEVVHALARWLQPSASEFSQLVPAMVDTDILFLPKGTKHKEAVKLVMRHVPSYAILEREHNGGSIHYALAGEEILSIAGKPGAGVHLFEALWLNEGDASGQISLASVTGHQLRRAVVFDRGAPVGVIASQGEAFPPFAALMGPARAHAMRSLDKILNDKVLNRRTKPAFAKPVHTPKSVECRFRASMPSQIQMGKAASIEVVVSRDQLQPVAGKAGGVASGRADPKRLLTVQVVPKAEFETVGDDRAEIPVPEPGQDAVLVFDVRPTHVGQGEVYVIARQGPVAIATILLCPAVVGGVAESARRVQVEKQAQAPPSTPFEHLLWIMEQKNGNEIRYQFQFFSPAAAQWTVHRSDPILTSASEYVSRLYEEIEQRWVSSREDAAAFEAQLRASGADLFEQLFPEKLRQILWDHYKSLDGIVVLSSEPFIPWEIVHLKEPGKPLGKEIMFLGQLGMVRWLLDVDLPPDRLRVGKDRVRTVVPNYPLADLKLAGAQEEESFLARRLKAKPVEPQPMVVQALLETPGGFDVLHFACHAEAEGKKLAGGELLLEGRVDGGNYIPARISAKVVKSFANLKAVDGTRPIVVLNACQSARAGHKLTGIGGFADSFLHTGAGLFIGTLWQVTDGLARTFVEEFYRQLLAGKKVSQAVKLARKKAREAGDPTWLAYTVYAHPAARLGE
ncbi:MAG: CHAT domain-containing protein [Acidobacteriia bacterium]|nr:CHAT domain-containing protein [Terriglobia bacterium]